jgi:hypothetical protein
MSPCIDVVRRRSIHAQVREPWLCSWCCCHRPSRPLTSLGRWAFQPMRPPSYGQPPQLTMPPPMPPGGPYGYGYPTSLVSAVPCLETALAKRLSRRGSTPQHAMTPLFVHPYASLGSALGTDCIVASTFSIPQGSGYSYAPYPMQQIQPMVYANRAPQGLYR